MKKILLILVLIFTTNLKAQFFQGFESSTNDNWTIVNGADSIKNDAGAAYFPPSQTILTGLNSWQVRNAIDTLELSTINISSITNPKVTIHLSSISVTSGNGSDLGDSVLVYLNINGLGFLGVNVSVLGNSNARWGYNSTLVATTSSSIPLSVQAPQAGTSTNNYGKIEITLPFGTNTVAMKIVGKNNATNEIWGVDDILLAGDCIPLSNLNVISFDASTCNSDGSIEISGLVPFTNYDLSYSEASGNSFGPISITSDNLGLYSFPVIPGEYFDFILSTTTCSDTIFSNVIVESPIVPTVNLNIINPTICGTNGTLEFTILEPNTVYNINYLRNSTLQNGTYTSDNSGKILISVGPDSYSMFEIENDATGCKSDVDLTVYNVTASVGVTNANLFGGTNFCDGDSVYLMVMVNGGIPPYTATINGSNYNLADSMAILAFLPTTTTTYTLTTIVDNNACNLSNLNSQQIYNFHLIPSKPILIQEVDTLKCTSLSSNYQWYFQGNAISGATFANYSPTQNGFYTLVVSNGFCENSDSILYTSTSISSKSNTSIEIYPNPTKDILNLNFNENIKNYSLVITNVLGEKVLEIENTNDKSIYVSYLISGFYNLLIKSSNEVWNSKFIKN